ncbi:MAG: hypothetical protein JWP97_1325 [Labilithrix sp.]|nr:hypothetical protein [Labilithrix sp.]
MLRVAKYTFASVSLLALLATAACGSKKPAHPPESDALDASASADMPGMPDTTGSVDGGATGSSASSDSTPPPAATLSLPTANAKAALKGKKALELKADGTVSSGGKAVAKISGMTLQNADGSKSLLNVGGDGAVTAGESATAYGSFSGDDLTLAKGDKVSVGDDGTVSWTSGAGKAATLGKFENLGGAKRAGALAVAFVVAPPAAEKAAAPAGKKPADTKKPTKK